MLVMASDGTLAADVRPLVRLNVAVIIEQDGRREQGYAGGGGRFAYTEFLASERWRALVQEAVRTAQVNLEAVPAPAGTMTVVLGAGLARRAAARGHRPRSRRRLQPQGHVGVQRPHRRSRSPRRGVTVVDDGTLAARRGSLNVDDEGTPTQCTTLIENGVLRGYLQDKLNARLMGVKPTGNGRREIVRAPDAAAHDQHLHAARASTRRRRSSPRSTRASTAAISAAARSTSRPASSCSRRARPT